MKTLIPELKIKGIKNKKRRKDIVFNFFKN